MKIRDWNTCCNKASRSHGLGLLPQLVDRIKYPFGFSRARIFTHVIVLRGMATDTSQALQGGTLIKRF